MGTFGELLTTDVMKKLTMLWLLGTPSGIMGTPLGDFWRTGVVGNLEFVETLMLLVGLTTL